MTAWTADSSGSNPLGVEVPQKDQYVHGLLCWGQNPAVGGPSCDFERKAMENLKWLVVTELWETETAAFWKRPGVDPTTIQTEVFLLPAACSYEKEGSISNSGRWSQWRYKAIDPPGLAMDDLSIVNELAKRLIALYQADTTLDWRLRYPVALLWWGPYCDPAGYYGTPHQDAHGADGSNYDDFVIDSRTGLLKASPHKVSWEMNGYFCPSSTTGTQGRRVDGFFNGTATNGTLQENGQTSSGNWLYCSHYVNPGDPGDQTGYGNRQENRGTVDNSASGIGLYSQWSYAWPLNRRIIYNGASVYQAGHPSVGLPLAPSKWVIAYDSGGTVLRAGSDVPDGYTPPGGTGPRYPFIMQREGQAHIFGAGREDGPFPEQYEPWESVFTVVQGNPLGTGVLTSPTNFGHARPEAYEHPGHGNPEFPIQGTTYRLTEHWQAGQLTRNNPWLCQLQPNPFVEMSEELAGLLGIVNGDWVEIKTQRSNVTSPSGNYGKTMEAVACVTKRFKPYVITGYSAEDPLHHIGLIWHFGYTGCCTGDSANLLTCHIGDANTGIPESKSFICNIRKLDGGSYL
jgi:anaerobic selenocysteine-containing dehydrogenase